MALFDEYAYEEYPVDRNPFAKASIVLGAISVITFSSIYPAIIAGSLSILFAILSRKGRKPLHPLAKTGVIISIISLSLAVLLAVFYLAQLPRLLQDESFRAQLTMILQNIYGSDVTLDQLFPLKGE